MKGTQEIQNVLVLTDRPWDYDADMRRLGLRPQYYPSAGELLEHLAEHPASGFVLEVDKVLRAQGLERDQLFQLSGVFPVLRVLRKGLDRYMAYQDDPEAFAELVRAFPPREVRHSGRVPVLLHGQLAADEDAAFASPVAANILDLSEVGGFVSTQGELGDGEKVRLVIEDMADRTPILASIRWRKDEGAARVRHGAGLRFLNIRPSQLGELLGRFMAPLKRAG